MKAWGKMGFERKRVFVSGGAGAVGTVLVERLTALGADLYVGDLKSRPRELPHGVIYRQGDLNGITARELGDFAPQVFFHLAATSECATGGSAWAEHTQHSVQLSHHLMTLLQDVDSLERVVYASSYQVYDPSLYQSPAAPRAAHPLRETDPVRPESLYGAARLLHEVELRAIGASERSRFTSASARVFRIYGRNSQDLISLWVRSLLRGETIEVRGSESQFDFIFADDVAEGLLRLASADATGAYNLGSGRARRVAELVQILRGHFPDMVVRADADDLPFEGSAAEMSHFVAGTGWAPATTLEQGVALVVEHERARSTERRGTAPHAAGGVLVCSASRKIPLLREVQRAMAHVGSTGVLHSADADGRALAQHFSGGFWQMPPISSLSVDAVVEYCARHEVGLIVPTRDGELPFFARHRQMLLEKHILALVPGPEAVQVCLDKLRFYVDLTACGYPVIPTFDNLDALDAERVVVKEREGAGARTIGLGLTRAEAEAHGRRLNSPIFQPFVEGVEYSVDVYTTQRGGVHGAVARRRELVVNGESQVTTTERSPILEALVSRIATGLKLLGPSVFQVIVDRAGTAHIIECNTRFGGASVLGVAAGLDVFVWALMEAQGGDLADLPFRRSRGELRLVRAPQDRIDAVTGRA